MKRHLFSLCVLLAVVCLALPAPGDDKKEEAKDWTQLFNGKDLTGWHQFPAGGPPTWSVKDGILKSASKVLFSNREDYENFQLRIEARLSA